MGCTMCDAFRLGLCQFAIQNILLARDIDKPTFGIDAYIGNIYWLFVRKSKKMQNNLYGYSLCRFMCFVLY